MEMRRVKDTRRIVRTPKQIKSRWKKATIVVMVGLCVLVGGLITGLITNHNLYGDVKGDVYKTAAEITGVNEQVDTEIQPSGSVSTVAYHLIASYNYKGHEKSTVLNESYLKQSSAENCIGSMRNVIIDTGDFSEIIKNDIANLHLMK